MISPQASNPQFTEIGDYIFSMQLSSSYEAELTAKMIVENYGYKNIAVIYSNDDWGVGVNTQFTDSIGEYGGSISADETFIAGQTKDFTPLISNPKSLLIGASWTDANDVEVAGKSRFFVGTVYDFQVYNKALTDAQVKTLLAAGLGNSTVTPSQPETPSNGLPTPRYKLAAPKTFVPANKEFIDTGIKPFAAIDTGMNLTVYATFTVADSAVNTVTVLLDCFSDLTNDQRGIMAATWTNGTVGMNMFTYGSHFVKIESGKKLKFLLQIKGTQFRFLSYGSLTEWKNIPNYASNKTVDRSLILGASWTAASGETTDGKARFFNGAVYDFQVFDTALTDAQITTLMEAN